MPGPAPRPLFAARRSKLAVARRRARGLTVGEIARLERVSEFEVIQTLGDAETARVTAVLAGLQAQPRALRIARLEDLALDIMECRVLAGCPRTAAFVVWCQRRGLAPDTTLAGAMLRAAERQALSSRPWHQGPLGRRLRPDDPPDPAPAAATAVVIDDPRSPLAPLHPAAFGADPAAAALQIEAEAVRVPDRLRATQARLAAELAREELRDAAAPASVPAFMESPADRRRAAQRRRARERKEARAAEAARRQAETGRPLDRYADGARVALRHFAESAAVEARMTLLRLHGPTGSPAAQAATKLHFWPRPPPFKLGP